MKNEENGVEVILMAKAVIESTPSICGFPEFNPDELAQAQEHTGETVEPGVIRDLKLVVWGLASGFGIYPVVDVSVGEEIRQ